ncbi:hypothetical protein, partial [Desulforudis sp. 1190]|uniref:hypothetical protein n=1 Tax=Desulforudis sp. 1190 TaxID=3416136 RepID=UPI003CE698A7
SGTVLSEGEVSVAADEDVRGRFRCQSVGRTLALGLACANLYVTEEDARSPRAPAELPGTQPGDSLKQTHLL